MITHKELRELLHYNPITGFFSWRTARSNRIKAGEKTGYLNDKGYITIRFKHNNKCQRYIAHRLAFFYMDGYFPENLIDHKNGTRDDNRWCNLREVNHMCNMQNVHIYVNNTSGVPGVYFNKAIGKWHASLTVAQKKIHLGFYRDKLEAALARLTGEIDCENWNCNKQNEIFKSIGLLWPSHNILV